MARIRYPMLWQQAKADQQRQAQLVSLLDRKRQGMVVFSPLALLHPVKYIVPGTRLLLVEPLDLCRVNVSGNAGRSKCGCHKASSIGHGSPSSNRFAPKKVLLDGTVAHNKKLRTQLMCP